MFQIPPVERCRVTIKLHSIALPQATILPAEPRARSLLSVIALTQYLDRRVSISLSECRKGSFGTAFQQATLQSFLYRSPLTRHGLQQQSQHQTLRAIMS